MDRGILSVVSSSWSVPMFSSPQGGMRKAPLCLVEAARAPRAPILTPGRAQTYLVLPGVEERTLNRPRFCLELTMWPWTNASSCRGLLPGLSNEGLCGGISKRSETGSPTRRPAVGSAGAGVLGPTVTTLPAGPAAGGGAAQAHPSQCQAAEPGDRGSRGGEVRGSLATGV